MSTRWYPIFQRGSPQLRVFLPNFWLKLVKPTQSQPPNVVQFACSMEMTKYDVKNYLENIYKIPIVDVRTRIALGRTKKAYPKSYIIKEDDIKYAYVTMPKDVTFTFPNIFPSDVKKEREDEQNKSIKDTKDNFKKYLDKNKERPGLPGWFSI
uniref:Large ribosomal subunit protein uL23m n=1 Tax=Corethrella appendiculata TaxID=1370023 RepID=U5EXX4_9DIPT